MVVCINHQSLYRCQELAWLEFLKLLWMMNEKITPSNQWLRKSIFMGGSYLFLLVLWPLTAAACSPVLSSNCTVEEPAPQTCALRRLLPLSHLPSGLLPCSLTTTPPPPIPIVLGFHRVPSSSAPHFSDSCLQHLVPSTSAITDITWTPLGRVREQLKLLHRSNRPHLTFAWVSPQPMGPALLPFLLPWTSTSPVPTLCHVSSLGTQRSLPAQFPDSPNRVSLSSLPAALQACPCSPIMLLLPRGICSRPSVHSFLLQ